jgi:transposase
MKRTPLKRVSRKRARQNAVYLKARKAFLLENPTCAACGEPSTEIHHKAGREGEWLNYQPFWMPVDAKCHRWITDNMEEAEALGWVVRIYGTFRDYIKSILNASGGLAETNTGQSPVQARS